MAEAPKCVVCDGVILPDETVAKDSEGRSIHRGCGGTVSGGGRNNELDRTPPRRPASAAQGGLPTLGKRRP
jgi:hypothetical protein